MALDFIRKEHYNTEDLIRIVALLRAPGGCPWDQAQTHASIKKNFIEETYEVIEVSTGRALRDCRRSWAMCCFRLRFMPKWRQKQVALILTM